jgi:YidC/Oxa1 family membrane protein insertase
MDYKRFTLIAGLAIVSYLMLLEWNRDYPAQPASQTSTTSAGQTPALSDLPDASAAPPSEDIPTVTSNNQGGPEETRLPLPPPAP